MKRGGEVKVAASNLKRKHMLAMGGKTMGKIFDNAGVNRSNAPSSLHPGQSTAPNSVGQPGANLAAARAADPQNRPYVNAGKPTPGIRATMKNPNNPAEKVPARTSKSDAPPVRQPC
jgi:hypothetical protein